MHIKKTSKFEGVIWHNMYNKWHVQIKLKNKASYLGLFKDPKKAAERYDLAHTRRASEKSLEDL